MKENNKLKIFSKDSDQINGLFDKGCSFEGKLTFDGVVQINGDFQGEILSDGTLIIGKDARIRANIQIGTLIVDGLVEGLVNAKNKIEIHREAKFIGDIITTSLVVEDGGALHGNCHMTSVEQPDLFKTNVSQKNERAISEDSNEQLIM